MSRQAGSFWFYFSCLIFLAGFLEVQESYHFQKVFLSKDSFKKDVSLESFGLFSQELIVNKTNLQEGNTDHKNVLIPEGEFQMGVDSQEGYNECIKYSDQCEPYWYFHESPKHNVNISAFYIDSHEIIQKDFKLIMGRNPSSFKGEYHPVENVTWLEATEYCQKVGKRLPTEAEWEKAARGKTVTKYYWGNEMESGKANFCDANCLYDWKAEQFNDGYVNTAPVGSYAPNEYGLYDLMGNVWEWVKDWYGPAYYKNSSSSDPQGPGGPGSVYEVLNLPFVSTGHRILRGGSWSSHPFDLRSSNRAGAHFKNRNINGYGFRCAFSAVAP